eukprot:m.177307 g.177307  ORF g.177307 m.177307 type:complete len:784 (+) comp17378_c0_seq1:143-2494(+)
MATVNSDPESHSGGSDEEAQAAEKVLRSERKIGHRKVDKITGETAYKKVKSSQLMEAIQMGVRQAVGGELMQQPDRDLLHQDFETVVVTSYPREGSNITPPHHYEDFKFFSYAPVAFRHFRKNFGIDTADFLLSLCDKPLRELSNPGASGSVFYLSHDDMFIIKTVQKGEHAFLRKLLPGYYMNMSQNSRTLLPKFFGLFEYSTLGRSIRFVVMNNLLPSRLTYYEQYDLKGSTFKRQASAKERLKKSPTLKDLDFMELHGTGLKMPKKQYEKLVSTLNRDCLVLESFKIMDYSLLMGLHNRSRDTDAGKAKDNDDKSDAHSAHQRTIARHDEGAHAAAVAAKAKVMPCVTISGREGNYSFLNGMYEEQIDKFNENKVYALKDGVPHGNGKMSGLPLLLYYDTQNKRWQVGPALGSPDYIAYAHGDSVTGLSGWHVIDVKGIFTADPKVEIVATLSPPLSLAPETRPRRMSFSNLTDQIDSEDDAGDDYGREYRGKRNSKPAASSSRNDDRRMASTHAQSSEEPPVGLVAYNEQGEELSVYIGIIDILQNYGPAKKMEHRWKSILHDGDTVSVHKPKFYKARFLKFMTERVFQPLDEPGNNNTNKEGASSPAMRPKSGGPVSMRRGVRATSPSKSPGTQRRTVPSIVTQSEGDSEEHVGDEASPSQYVPPKVIRETMLNTDASPARGGPSVATNSSSSSAATAAAASAGTRPAATALSLSLPSTTAAAAAGTAAADDDEAPPSPADAQARVSSVTKLLLRPAFHREDSAAGDVSESDDNDFVV